MAFDLFLLPFLTGLALAVLLPLLGCYLRLRQQWLAALAYAQMAAAGALTAAVVALPALLGGLLAASLAGLLRPLSARRLSGMAGDVLLLLAGWAASVLLVAHWPQAERLGHSLFDGQLYFAGERELGLALMALLLALLWLYRGHRGLLLAQLWPDLQRLRGQALWPSQVGFDVLVALCLAVATLGLGVMAVFALAFIPPWLAFRRQRNWRQALGYAVLLAVLAYGLAFALALSLDLPFGPVLALLLVIGAVFIA
ncbi:MAG: metal ABC transporter permease [Dechloromonas sp.]|nr:metal ABC transporter permease [Dechloromonas sp.]